MAKGWFFALVSILISIVKSNCQMVNCDKSYFNLEGTINELISQQNTCRDISQREKYDVPALYVFGDSSVDSGNNNNLNTLHKLNYIPYGVDFPSQATGRCTNGRTFADNIGSYLGLNFTPPYMGLTPAERGKISTGINYASTGCGILPDTGTNSKNRGDLSKKTCFSLDDQVDNFKKSVEEDLPKAGVKDVKLHLSKSIFLVSLGTNDLVNNYYVGANTNPTPKSEFFPALVDQLLQRLRRIYEIGGRKFLVSNVRPIGCGPGPIAMMNPGGDSCLEDSNREVSLHYNKNLPSKLEKLKKELPGFIYTVGDVFRILTQVLESPKKFGIENTKDACCAEKFMCKPNSVLCKDRDKYLYFDGSHIAQIGHDIFAATCIKDNTICTPLTFKQLAAAA